MKIDINLENIKEREKAARQDMSDLIAEVERLRNSENRWLEEVLELKKRCDCGARIL